MRSAYTTTISALALAAVVTAAVAAAPVAQPTVTGRGAAVCHVATAGSDLLRSTRCSAGTLAYRLGYTPELVRLPSGRAVHVEPDGSCSWIPDRPLGFDFRNACRMHDLGYDLIRVRWLDHGAKAHVDRALHDGMRDACTRERGWRGLTCRAMAGAAWLAASLTPTPDRPDPGSFTTPATTQVARAVEP